MFSYCGMRETFCRVRLARPDAMMPIRAIPPCIWCAFGVCLDCRYLKVMVRTRAVALSFM